MSFIYNKIERLKETHCCDETCVKITRDIVEALESMEGQIERLQEKCVKMQEQMNKLEDSISKHRHFRGW